MTNYYKIDRQIAQGDDLHTDALPGWAKQHAAKVQMPVAIPSWVKERPQQKRWHSLMPWFAATAIATTAALLFVFVPFQQEPYVAVKGGSPAVGVWIKRGETVTQWDGQNIVRPGDELRLKVTSPTWDHVAIYALDPISTSPRLLYQMEVPLGVEVLLPKAWRVDHVGNEEKILVLFAKEVPDIDQIPNEFIHPSRSDEIFSIVVSIPKELH